MNISWIVTPHYYTDVNIKSIGPVWGCSETWQIFETDNVVCFDYRHAADLIVRNFQQKCNLYIPENFYSDLNRPSSVNLVGGKFSNDIDKKEEIVACHLVSKTSDIILLGGFDLSSDFKQLDDYELRRTDNFLNNFQSIIGSSNSVQWVLLDHKKDIDDRFRHLSNLTQDTTSNVVSLLTD